MEPHYRKKLNEYEKKFGIAKLTLEPDSAVAREKSIASWMAENERREHLKRELFSKKIAFGEAGNRQTMSRLLFDVRY